MMPVDSGSQGSPFQALMEQAILAELSRGRQQIAPATIRENLTPEHNRVSYDQYDRPYMEHVAGQQSQMANLVQADAQSRAVQTAGQDQRLQSLLGTYGQMGSANADLMRAQVGQDELAWKKSPEGQKFAMDMAAANQGMPPNSVGVQMANTDALARKGLGVPLGAPLPSADAGLQSLIDRGVLPGSPEAEAFGQTYPAEKTKWLEGEPAPPPGDVNEGLIGLFGQDSPWGQAKASKSKVYSNARRMFGGGPAAIGVPAAAGPTAKPGVLSPTERAASPEARKRKEDGVRRINAGSPMAIPFG